MSQAWEVVPRDPPTISLRSGFGEAPRVKTPSQRFVLPTTVYLLQGDALVIIHEHIKADCLQAFGFMIEPLAHVAKGSVSRFTVVASSVGSVHFPKSQFLRKDFFTPLPRPARTEDAPSQQSESFSILQSREHTKQCRLWSCLPGSHSVWCPSASRFQLFVLTYLKWNAITHRSRRISVSRTYSKTAWPSDIFPF
jgi:hypothetical protein